MTRMPDIDLAQIAPVTDTEAARLASPAAFTDLARQITAQPPSAGPAPAHPEHTRQGRPGRARGWSRRRTLLTGLPLAAAAAAAALVAILLAPGGSGTSGTTAGPNSQAAVQAVSFTKENGYITVIIRNPYVDSSWYNADFARHHLDIKLSLIPASPTFVGAIEEMSVDSSATDREITMINKPGSCGLDGNGCTIGFKVPVSFHGQASMAIGRPARPGEQYATTGSAFSPGEILYGLKDQVYGRPLSQVLALFARHHVTVAVCRGPSNTNINPSTAPGNWYVQDVLPWAPGQVIIWVGPKRVAAAAQPPAPASAQPPSPAAR
jgi:hypothetical protein